MNYQNSKIYRIICDDGHYYYGSTITDLKRRLAGHKCKSKTENSKVYNHINSIGWDRVKIELIENFECNSKRDLTKREDYYIFEKKLDPLCLNTMRAFVTQEESNKTRKYYIDKNKEHINKLAKQSRESHIGRQSKYAHTWYEKNKEECIQKSMKYYEQNKENELLKRKQYYQANRTRILKSKQERYLKNKENNE
jgi:hypothetical protein